MQTQNPPGGVSKQDNANLPRRKILLISNVLVRRQEEIKSFSLSGRKQFAIREFLPAAFDRLCDFVPGKRSGNSARRAVIKEDAHCSRQARWQEPERCPDCGRQNPAQPESAPALH